MAIKTINGIAIASIKTWNGIAADSVKALNGETWPPSSIYNAITRSGTGASATITSGVNLTSGLVVTKARSATTGWRFTDTVRGVGNSLDTSSTGGEVSEAQGITAFSSAGYTVGTDTNYNNSTGPVTYVDYALKTYAGAFDMVGFTADGSGNYSGGHSLGVTPELFIWKNRSVGAGGWITSSPYLTSSSYYLNLATDTAETNFGTQLNACTASVISNGTSATMVPSATHIAYLFATLAGISKVGSYTGNGTSQTLNMGFSAGARFFMCKRIDAAGNWHVWDSERGIATGNDPYLGLNLTNAEVTTEDSVDPDNSGIIVNEITATHINVNTATYIYLAFA